jgi:hypothetical protein
MRTLNTHTALKPIKISVVTDKRARGLDITDSTVMQIIATEVLFDSDEFKKGDVVYVRTDSLKLPHFRNKLEIGGVEFCLVPDEFIVMVDYHARPRPAPLPLSSNGTP